MTKIRLIMTQWSNWFRKIGQAMMLPVAVLPLGGLLMMIGDLTARGGFIYASVLTNSGTVLIEQLPLLIAVCLAYSLAVEMPGLAAFSGAVAFLVLNKTGAAFFALLNIGSADAADFNMGVFAGVIAGVLASILHNRFQKLHLPSWLGLIEGSRSLPIMTAVGAFLAGLISGALWTGLYRGFVLAAERITTAGSGGAFVYGFLNRLLMPLGLHHALNQEIWFNFGEYTNQSGYLILGDLNRFLAGDPSAGRLISGFFPMMIFAVPAIVLCFLFTARPRRRIFLSGMLILAGVVSLVSGVTEPVEYLLLFTSPLLYLIYAVLYGLSMLICYQLQVLYGFNFSAGLTDYLANWSLATNPERIWQVGLVMAVLTFAIFYFAITLLRLKTPGREDMTADVQPIAKTEETADTETADSPEDSETTEPEEKE